MTSPLPCPAVAAGDAPVLAFRVAAMPPKRTAQQKGAFVRNGRVRFYTKAAVRQEESNTVALVLSKLPQDWKPVEGPVALTLRLVYPYRRSEPKRRTRDGDELPHDRKPDLDNLSKGIIDSIVRAGCILDDSQIAVMNLSKSWGPAPYWEVRVDRLEDDSPASGPRSAQEREEGAGRPRTRGRGDGRSTREAGASYGAPVLEGMEAWA